MTGGGVGERADAPAARRGRSRRRHVMVERDDVEAARAASRARPASPLDACSTAIAARARASARTRRAEAGDRRRCRGCGPASVMAVRRRNLHHGEEQAELADGVGEALVVHRLGDVDVGAEIVAALDLALVVGRRQHDTGERCVCGLALSLGQDVDAGHVRQVEVEQDQQRALGARRRPIRPRRAGRSSAVGAVAEGHDLVVDAGAADVALDQPRMALVVLDHHDRRRDGAFRLASLMRVELSVEAAVPCGRSTLKVEPSAELGCDG